MTSVLPKAAPQGVGCQGTRTTESERRRLTIIPTTVNESHATTITKISPAEGLRGERRVAVLYAARSRKSLRSVFGGVSTLLAGLTPDERNP